MARVPPVVEVDFVITTGNYDSFIDDLRAKLANHPDPEDVEGHPVLAKQSSPQKPARWIHVNLSADANKAAILGAVRDDNVYLIGFKAQSGNWYEFGFEAESVPMITGSTFLECGPDYRSLLGGSSSREVRANLIKLQLGKSVAEEAVLKLSGYVQQGAPDDATKLGLARLIVMVCESARMISISDTVSKGWASGTSISDNQVEYLWNWGLMSEALLGWKKYGDKYKWPKKLTKIEIKNEAEALAVVQLLLNKPPKQLSSPPLAADNEEDECRTAWHLHAAADNDGLGRPLVEVFSMRAGFPVIGTIAVFDGIRGQIIYKQDLHLQRTLEGEMVLTGPYRAISADGSFVIKVDIDSAGEPSTIGASGNAGGTLSWDCYDDGANAVYDVPLTWPISTAHGPVEVTYAVLTNAVEATVQVRLLLVAEAGTFIHGKVTARSKAFDVASVLFSHDSEDKVAIASDDSTVPLSRSVVAVPLNSPLEVEASFHTPEGIVRGKFELYPELSGEHVKSVFTEHGEIEVKVTWSDI
ncbi:60 kDa jasmonate-induced protein-like isoform X2 [Phragmites australis]|uniref:60 kDa jasmonate-induced protein-like isoform X2 n=1 Tax=Phragmites australis TaxID=29695 RepID=UPI002D789F5F|nr:60 kDa jasmonate-induced protein-like isoform X2 [Phragmites australis]